MDGECFRTSYTTDREHLYESKHSVLWKHVANLATVHLGLVKPLQRTFGHWLSNDFCGWDGKVTCVRDRQFVGFPEIFIDFLPGKLDSVYEL